MSVDPTDPALIAAADEAVDTAATTVNWEGVTVTVPPNLEGVDPDAIEALENGKAMTFLRLVIGSDEYEKARRRFRSLHGRPATLRDVAGDDSEDSDASKRSLAGLVAIHFGFDTAGE
jgi:hypothetical protein